MTRRPVCEPSSAAVPTCEYRFDSVEHDAQDPDRDERLPAPSGRHPGLPAQHGAAPGPRTTRRLRLHVEARPRGCRGDRGVRRRAALHRRTGPHDDAAPDARRHPPRGRPAARTRLYVGVVRGGRPARPDGTRAAPGGRPPHRGDHARARGRLGPAARRTHPAAPHRRVHRHDHLPRRVHALPHRRRPDARGRRAHGPAAARRRRGDLPPGVRRCGGPRPARPHRPAGRRLRLPPGPAQGPGHPRPRDAPRPGQAPGRGAADRRRRALREGPARPRPRHRGDGVGPVHRGGALVGTARALRRRRRLRDAVPYAPGRPRRRGARHRVPGGVGDGPAGGGRRLGRRARRSARR